MAIKVAIRHKTTYLYDRLVGMSPHVFRLRPASHSRTPIEGYSFNIEPKEHFINWQQDPFGNYQARIVFNEKTTKLVVDVEVIARMEVINPFDFFVEEYAESYPFVYSTLLKKELVSYLEVTESGPLLTNWLKQIDRTTKIRIVDFLVDVNKRISKEINYTIRMEPGVQSCEESLTKKLGSCRDSAWLLVQVLRHLGLAARFVSGYLVQLTADVKSLDGPSGPEKDFTDLHAWTEVYIPGAGWIGLDPTSGLFASEGHIPLCCTPHYSSAAPVSGATDICEVTFEFENSVTRIHEDPRVTKPYTDEQWDDIYNLGLKIDQDLQDRDVRMTMGGEPTFVAIDNMDAPEWNTAADGLQKRKLAYELAFRLRDRFALGGLLHFGQGKWYPGEPFPRWQYGLFWRKDGWPLWNNPALTAKEGQTEYAYKEAGIFMIELSKFLAVDEKNITPAYEDPIYWMLEEGRVPINLDPLDVNLKDPIERRTLAQHLEQGLNTPVGFVLPLHWNYWNSSWMSCEWQFRRNHLFLIPGNSPIGLRMPLESLPFVAKNKRLQHVERSLFEELKALDKFEDQVQARYGTVSTPEMPVENSKTPDTVNDKKSKDKKKVEEVDDKTPLFDVNVIRTALSVEVRQGTLYLFLPPVHYLEHYVDLVASIEATAAKLNMPVRIEGYEPPKDYRLERLVVSPDPGVIEVNIHPASTWQQLVDNTTALYEEAFYARLGTEKFMVDGRHTGTGGGNHITIGGATPFDSPLLRRPDLLRSLITYWQHHPCLSYLFSGSFIGPTSQAPRIDEARNERLYEMEIAFDQVPEPSGFIPYWLVDRIFRHLLTDMTGNTHRSEFCIDKLYSPDSSSGRLGILEFRGFDMPPHKHMSLVQQLLIRGLVSMFWRNPYKKKLVRWDTELHDKFLLPHFSYLDMKDVVQDLNDFGYDFKMSWFEPFFEFRYPTFGRMQLNSGVELEIRFGIEPWNVLGEEMSSTGTARFVDSSLERVQVRVTGFVESRFVLTCNGCRVPLRSTGTKGEFVAGIRFRAWNPPSALHPTIGVDAPLVFDIVDSWNGRSVGGCTYFVSHPGGLSYESYPINSYEAESRRISRFWNFGHTPELPATTAIPFRVQQNVSRFVAQHKLETVYAATRELVNEDYPLTLDLRRYWKVK